VRIGWLIGVGSALLIAGCSVPDAVNPVKWYEGVADAVAGDEDVPPPETEETFPSLGTVPEAPENVTTAEDFEQVAEGLAADRENAQYTDEAIRRADDEVEGELPLVEPSAAPAEEQATESEIAPAEEMAQAEPEAETTEVAQATPEPVAEEVAPPPAETLNGEEPALTQAAVAAPAQPLPGTSGDVAAMFYAAYAASGAKTLPTMAPAAATGAVGGASAAPTYAAEPGVGAWGAPTRLAGSVAFAEGSARLDDGARADLLAIAYQYGASGGPIRIVGHASPSGSANEATRKLTNLDIALDRALAVAHALEEMGVPASRMQIEARPEDGTALLDQVAGGRRVDVYIGS
jgi:outer membrane protein OmpA-like peptidoglycan-associated protein